MNVITISRQFGSGGRELGKRLADELGYDYYDREIISAIAARRGLDEGFVEAALEGQGWRSFPLTYGHTLTLGDYGSAQARLLAEESKVIKAIAERGRDCVIVGRNADVLLAEHEPFNIFVCADMPSRLRRCEERGAAGEAARGERQLTAEILRIDRARAKTRSLITDKRRGDPENYHLTVNTSGWEIKELVPLVKQFVLKYSEKRD